MVPAEQCLDAGNRPGRQLNSGLESKRELIGRERFTQLGVELERFARGVEHPLFVHCITTFAGSLRRVHGNVGVSQQLAGGGVRAGLSDADAHRREDGVFTDLNLVRRNAEQPFRQGPRLLHPAVFEQDGKLVTTHPRHCVDVADAAGDPPRNGHQELVTALMTE